MANTVTKEITVQELSKFGFKANNQYVNWSKNVTDKDKGKVVPGGTYMCEVYVADSGKEYVNKVLAENVSTNPAVSTSQVTKPVETVNEKVDTARAKRYTPKAEEVSKGLSKDEWADKDRRISRQGCIQAAVQAVAPVVALEQLWNTAETLATQMLEFVNRR